MSDRIAVIAVAPCFVGGARRRAGEEFTIVRDDYVDWQGSFQLPGCLVPASDRGRAQKLISELESRPVRAAIAAAGQGAEIRGNHPRDYRAGKVRHDTPIREGK